MSEKPFVSVMMLCYNYSTLLKKALEACAKQTFRDFEIVIINNGSTDDTEEVFKTFCEEHPDILIQYVLVENNQGPTHGWNVGLPYAKGEYVLFNDADDWMEPNCLEKLVKKAKETGSDRVMGQYQEVLPDGTVSRIRTFPKNSSLLPTTLLQGTIFKNSIIKENQLFFPEDVLVPYDLWFMYNFAKSEKNHATLVREIVYNYFYNPNSITQKMQRLDFSDSCLKKEIFPLLEITAKAINNEKDKMLRDQMEYLSVRNTYASIVFYYKKLSVQNANEFYARVMEKLSEELPDYKDNPLIKPFNNGYETTGSIAVWVFVQLKKIGVLRFFLKILKQFYNTKLLRITTNEEK